ncbi:hypothetical protein CDAR_195071 [Caerostris darwini]|uniref:Uncharacterized protein n=1 Tax=Caerostris darwini TaxID=1538125 RepID=A0AAV4X6J7_9ARAC|nr:hypothetical protein CDAR_195071 [Caerostris darwini]
MHLQQTFAKINFYFLPSRLDGASDTIQTTRHRMEVRRKNNCCHSRFTSLFTRSQQNFPSQSVTTLLTLFFTLEWQRRRPGRLIKPFIKISWMRTGGGMSQEKMGVGCGGGFRDHVAPLSFSLGWIASIVLYLRVTQ